MKPSPTTARPAPLGQHRCGRLLELLVACFRFSVQTSSLDILQRFTHVQRHHVAPGTHGGFQLAAPSLLPMTPPDGFSLIESVAFRHHHTKSPTTHLSQYRAYHSVRPTPSLDSDSTTMAMSTMDEILRPACTSVTPHRLCRCCKKFAAYAVPLLPRLDEDEKIICPQYETWPDLVCGAREGCHFCFLVMAKLDGSMPDWLQIKKDAPNGIFLSTTVYGWDHDTRDHKLSIKEAGVDTSDSQKALTDSGGRDETSIDLGEREHNVYLTLHNVSAPDDIPDWAKRAQISSHTGSEEQYEMIRQWLDGCVNSPEHSSCNKKEKFGRPTRLLDLSLNCTDDIRLVQGDSSDEPYAALSYCWGSVPQLMLLRTNLQQFQKRIRFADLSKVSQDAIAVCRNLLISYLWIDALCIVQGEDGDFLSEAPRMQEVYAGSIFTVVAASSKDTTEPFLVHRNPLQWLDCNLGPAGDLAADSFRVTADDYCGANEPGAYHIDSRAWYLQERLMSPRSIYFGKKGIHWECRKGVACEFDPDVKNISHNSREGSRRDGTQINYLKSEYAELQSMQSKSISDVPGAHGIWRHLLRTYSTMGLTHPEDALIAIAGIASIFQSKFDRRSTYGLWIDSIVQELLWYCKTNSSEENDKASTGHLPSWSWTSMNGHPICTDFPVNMNHLMDDFCSATPISWPSDSGFNMSLLQSLKDKRLCIRGHLAPYTETWTGVKPNHLPTKTEGRNYRRHIRDPNTSETDLYCLLLLCQISSEEGYTEHFNYGLVLTPANIAERCYRRIGVILERHSADEFPDAPDTQLVQGRFLTDLWAPVGEEQQVFIV